MSSEEKQLAVFFDRDGTLNIERGYIRDLEHLELYPGTAQAIRKLNDLGVLCILTTNQTGAARGFYDIEHIHALNNKVNALLFEQAQAHLDALYYSPYYARGVVPEFTKESDCRKPGTGMIRKALTDFPQINLSTAYIVGDKATDVEFSHNAGARGILLKTGYGQNVLQGKYQALAHEPAAVCETVAEAVDLIIATWQKEELL
jgi:D-glycero-D-manno-heptose 1,7-bisphosphate phosphatase